MAAQKQVLSSQGHPFSCAYFKHSRWFLLAARKQVHFHPKDTRFRARISKTRGDHFWQLQNMSFHSKDIRFRVRISNTRCDHFWQLLVQVFSSQGHPFSCANISNTRCDHFWQLDTSPFIPITTVFVRVFQTLEVTIFGSKITSPFIPRTSFFVRIFQKLEVTICGSSKINKRTFFIPRTSVFVRVFQTLEVTILGSSSTSLTRFRARISNTGGDLLRQPNNKSFHPRTSFFVRVFQTF